MTEPVAPTVRHLPDRQHFEATVDGERAKLVYRLNGGVLTIVHTEVPHALEGHGIAAALMRAALDHAKAEGLKVDPQCSYALAYFERHPETKALLVSSA